METEQEGFFLKRIHEVSGGILRCLLALSFLTICPSLSGASSVQYIYDNLGRLIMTVSGSGTKIIYGYDAAGRVISVTRTSENQQAPVLTGINPQNAFIGNEVSFTLTGSNLSTTHDVSIDNPGVKIVNFSVTNNSVTVVAQIMKTAATGPATFTVTTLTGTASISLNLLNLTFAPAQLVLATGTTGSVTVRIDGLKSDYNLPLTNQNPASISVPQSLTVPVTGSTTFAVNGIAQGNGVITAGNSAMQFFISDPLTGPVSAVSNPMSVKFGPIVSGGFTSNPVSVQLGAVSNGIVVSEAVCVTISKQ